MTIEQWYPNPSLFPLDFPAGMLAYGRSGLLSVCDVLCYIQPITALIKASLVAQSVKNLHAMLDNREQSLGWEDPPEEGMATHSNILAWEIPWKGEPGRLQSMRSQENWIKLTISPQIIYMFQCCSLETSHPCLLPQSPKFCYVHLCLFPILHIGLLLPSF